jgi:hypothetical protein
MRSLRQTRRLTRLLVTFACAALACAGTALAEANHTGWPRQEHHEGHPHNESGVMWGEEGVHNYLLGGGGNDRIHGGNDGDVIWGDSHPGEQPTSQQDFLYGGEGEDWIYASYGFSEIWTGAGNDHIALVYGHGIVFCNGPGLKTLVMRYLPQNRPWKLVGCDHKVIFPYRA